MSHGSGDRDADASSLASELAAEAQAIVDRRRTMSPGSAAAITLPALDLEPLREAADVVPPRPPRAVTAVGADMSPGSMAAITLPPDDEPPRKRPPSVPMSSTMTPGSAAAITLPAIELPSLEPSPVAKMKTASAVAITLPPEAAYAATQGSSAPSPRADSSFDALAATVAPAAATDETLPANDPARDLPAFGHVDGSAYALGTEIARGGMGRILAARDRRLRRDVVVKVLRTNDAASARFEREALITARLQHPSIVRIYDAGRLDGKRPFYAMERVRGQALDRVIATAADFRARLALLPHVIAVADALAYAHAEGVIHRDLKPANVLVGSYGETVVIDWGLAKDLRAIEPTESDERRARAQSIPPIRERDLAREQWAAQLEANAGLTVAGSVMGTPAYMAPEQARGEPADPRSDVYAIGAILYTVLSGKQPITGSSATEILDAVATGKITRLREHVPNAPAELVTIVEHAMAHDPAARFATAKQLADELRDYAAGKLVSTHAYTLGALLKRWVRRHRAVLGVAAFAVVVLTILLVVGVQRIVRERDRADAQTREALAAKQQVEAKSDSFVIDQATTAMREDPARTLAWLRHLTARGTYLPQARELADRAVARGVGFELRGSKDDVEHVVVSLDGSYAYTGGDDGRVWRWELGLRRGRELGGHGSSVETIALSPDGRYLASGSTDDSVLLWDLATLVPRTLEGHTGAVRGLAFSPDTSQLASTGEDNALWIWDLATGDGRLALTNQHALRPVVWSKDGTAVWTGAANGHVLGVELAPAFWIVPAPLTPQPPLRIHANETRTLALSPDGSQLASGGEDGAVFVWRVDQRVPKQVTTHADVARDVVWTPDGSTLVTGGGGNEVHVVELATGKTTVLAGNVSGVKDLAVSRDGKLVASAGIDGTVRVWRITGEHTHDFVGHSGGIKSVAFSPDGTHVVSASDDDSLRYWPLDRGTPAPTGPSLAAWIDAHTNVQTEAVTPSAE